MFPTSIQDNIAIHSQKVRNVGDYPIYDYIQILVT